jgi:hypothetical protein
MAIKKEELYTLYWDNNLSQQELRTLVVQLCLDNELYEWFTKRIKERANQSEA